MQESGLITCAKHYILYEQDALCTGPIIDGLRTGCEYTSAEVDGDSLLLWARSELKCFPRQDRERALPSELR